MKLIRFGEPGAEKPGIITADDNWIDVSAFVSDYDEAFFASKGLSRLARWLQENEEKCPILNQNTRLGSCVARPSKIICIGLNYAKHAAESGMAPPSEPVVFFKASSALCGPFDDVVIPRDSKKTDWEVELAVVIGSRASYVSKDDAMNYIAGYAVHNDYSERAFQLEQGGQWVKGKSCDTFAPVGPFLATADEIDDPHNLNLWLKVNEEKLQDSSTSDLIFDIPTLISYLSNYMTLLPGDIISTGTPAGVGLGFDPPRFLQPGDIVELGIENLGVARQTAVAYQG